LRPAMTPRPVAARQQAQKPLVQTVGLPTVLQDTK
jgi:hypothetical protein